MRKNRILTILLAFAMMALYTVSPAGWVYAEDGAAFDAQAVYESLRAMSDGEISEYLDTLSEAERAQLLDYAESQNAAQNDETVFTVPFTSAGPFMPAVKVSSTRRPALKAAGSGGSGDDPDGNGLSLKKTVTANGDGTFKVSIESWTTGTVRTETVTTPVDIVIVIDQSESMGYDFAGNDHIDVPTGLIWPRYREEPIPVADTRQYAMKTAVNAFIDQVAEKYDAAESDHRMAVVTFGSTVNTLQGWTDVSAAGKNTLEAGINGLPSYPSGAVAEAGAGMQTAENLLTGAGYTYSGTNTTRKKVVIVFTDGIPGSDTFDTARANTALQSAYNMKDEGATVYTVGIFNGANPAELHGDKWDYTVYSDIPCTGEVGTYWGGSWVSSIVGQNDFEGVDIAAGNRFLNYLSSNYPSASSIGVSRGLYDPGSHSTSWLSTYGTGYRITQNYDRDATGYYLTANDADSISAIFEEISTNIENPKIELGETAAVQDCLSQYFSIVGGESGVTVRTADYNGSAFGGAAAFGDADVSIDEDGVLRVSGFDYAENFVSETVKANGTYGKKLIIEFNVTPDSDLLGGNDIPIDLDTSGVYAPQSGELTKVESLPVSAGNVAVRPFEALDGVLNLYRGAVPAAGDITGAVSTRTVDLDASNWITDFVTVGRQAQSTGTGTHTVTVTVSPKTNGQNAAGTPAAAVSDTAQVTEYVFDPLIIFKDSEIYLGEAIPTNFDANLVGSVIWKNDELDQYSTEVTMTGQEPTISYTYTPAKTGTADTAEDIGVSVAASGTVGTATVDYSDYIGHLKCTNHPDVLGDYNLLVHVKTCSLTIEKTGAAARDENQAFLFHVESANGKVSLDVAIHGNGAVTLTGLPTGNYTVTENTDWSWRYTPVLGSKNIVLSSGQGADGTLQFGNARTLGKWLSGDSYNRNLFR